MLTRSATERSPTIGILYPGEMGAALGRVLISDGSPIVTTLEGRSARTQRLCRDSGLEVLPSLSDVVEAADIVVSLVHPAAALPMARRYAELAARAPRERLYVDANSVSPATAAEIGRLLAAADVDCVDAAINGLASALRSGAVIYLSGKRAPELERLLARSLQVRRVGEEPGKASALKGLLAGLSKGLSSLFIELAVAAHESSLSEPFLERCRSFYPGVMEVVDRMLPTYPQHAGRRAEELGELEHAMAAMGVCSEMVRAAKRNTEAIAAAKLGQVNGGSKWMPDAVLAALHASGAFTASARTRADT